MEPTIDDRDVVEVVETPTPVIDAETFLALVKHLDERPSEHGLRDFLSILR